MNTNCTASKRKPRLYKIIIPAAVSFAVLISLLALHAFGGVFYPGDVNVDKSIDVSDAVLLSRFCAEDPNAMISRQGMTNADANQDQTIDDQDSLHILRMIAKQVPMPPNPYIETAPGMETTSAETETTSVESTVSTATVTTTVSISDTEPAQPEISDFTADQTQYPLGVSISVLSGKTEPNEMLTVNYEIGNIIFAIFANDPKNTTVAIAYQDDIVGYYRICSEYTPPSGYSVREYRDEFNSETGELYAVTVLRADVSIRFDKLANRDDLEVLSKLNYYALNGLRARNGLPVLEWHPELAKIARAHSVDMAANNMFEHHSSDGTSRKDRMLNAGIDYMAGGENIDRGQFDTFDALDGWLGSDVHRENLLSTDFTHIGVGFAYNKDADGYFYGTQDFCSFFPD